MTGAEILLACVVVVILVLAVSIRTAAKAALAQRTVDADVLLAALAPPSAPPVAPPPSAPAAPAKPAPKPDTVVCRFVSARGQDLGTTTIERKHRRPTLQYRTKSGTLGNFVFEGKMGREYRYRYIGKDRE